jgi:hypothetical protein
MKTNIYPRTIFIFLFLFTLLTSCKVKNSDVTKVRDQAATLAADQKAALDLVGDRTLQEAAPALWAIDQASVVMAPGAFMLLNQNREIAIFIAQGGLAPNGSPYTFVGVIDTAHNCIVDATRQFSLLNVDLSNVKTIDELKAVLKNRDFVELTEKTAPTILATIRLALGFLKTVGVGIATTMGTTISDVLVVPAGVLTPEFYYPWCDQGKGCQIIEQ